MGEVAEMKGKDILQSLVAEGKPKPAAESAAPPMRTPGSVKVMGIGLEKLSADAAEARRLRDQIANSGTIQELDPALFEPSIVRDRIPSAIDPKYDELKAAIAESGQQIPIIARPHPETEGKFQIAAGHRRWRVADELGRKVKAIIRKLTDQELVVLQGQENGPRADLSFIERARFALQMETRGIDRDTIASALSIDKPELSRLLTVSQTLGEDLIVKIGPAPKVGRPRWLKLIDGLELPNAQARLSAAVESDAFERAETDSRFAIALDAVGRRERVTRTRLNSAKRVAWFETKGKNTHLVCEDAGFSAFLERRLPTLLEEFKATAEPNSNGTGKGGTR